MLHLRCLQTQLQLAFDDDGLVTSSSRDQADVEHNVEKCYNRFRNISHIDFEYEITVLYTGFQLFIHRIPKLLRTQNLQYLQKGLFTPLQRKFESLDASKPWLTYWISHSLALLGDQSSLGVEINLKNQYLISCIIVHASKRIINFLLTCNNDGGGYGGGPGQMSHLATTYAAINALVTLENEDALRSINRKSLLQFLSRMKQEDGSFTMHDDGECDIRGVYCAISVAYLCGIQSEQLFKNTGTWIVSCQTYEGGFGAVPGSEAHGGYTFCAVAALMLLGLMHTCDVDSLLRWVVNKQYSLEGGFAGRTNKLVDACYSFWQGAVLPIIHAFLCSSQRDTTPVDTWLFNQEALQEYILCCCQDVNGGIIDKPEKQRDYYHTCYGLSGLSIAQHTLGKEIVVGPNQNTLVPTHPVFNVKLEAVKFAQHFFSDKSDL
ncbi:Protein farnesyltransferase subunit beta-like protein [Leptotrombidium deliense]|uniref:Protein farnesyltransferase subunit beta n=1 Tax=Leptotrombidium deliense TaxID=299467 RepID=A0A443SKQ2_9ACAR|nr:Protein farnesyltransferase subunit beta-like protein [Leptotrombidium deliense]